MTHNDRARERKPGEPPPPPPSGASAPEPEPIAPASPMPKAARQPDPSRVAPGRSAPAPVAPGTPPPSTPAGPVAPDEHRGSTPPEVAAQVGRVLGQARSAEEQLAVALGLVMDRHSADPELRDVLALLGSWSRAHGAAIEPFGDRYRLVPSEQPERLRSALLSGTRIGGPGVLLDLQDLLTLAFSVKTLWVVVSQGAKELRDKQLQALAADAGEQTDRTIAFLRTKLMHVAPQALTVPMDVPTEVKAAVPKRATGGGIPDLTWGPIAAGGLVALVGLAGVLVGRPFLLPSLGPTAALVGVSPGQPEARAWNTVAGHGGGLVAGLIAVILTGAANAPTVFTDKVLAPERALASVIAIALTIVLGILLRASHPPAAATTLLVSLGGIRTLEDGLNLAVGVVLIALAGEGLRRLRLHGLPPTPVEAPVSVTSRIRLERPPG
jgi:hypothetical protein